MNIKKILFKTNEIDAEKALPDAIIFCSKDGKIQWVNDKAAEVFSTQKMHLLTSNITDFIENALNLVQNAIQLNKPLITKLIDNEVYFDMSANETEDGYVMSFRNAVGSKTTNEEVVNEDYKIVNREKNNFIVKLANDFKSPLQSIVGFSQAMSDGLGGKMSEQQEKYIKIIKKNSTDLMYFVSKLIELSQSEAEIRTPEYKTFDILNLVNSTVRFNEQLNKDKDVRWTVNVVEGFKNTVTQDEELIRNILQNIIEVVIKTIDIGELAVSLALPDEDFLKEKNVSGDYMLLSISSGSMLLSENDLDCIFDPYKILDTANRKNVLRAIILATVKNFVQSLNGLIWVESKILKATNFNVLIPLK